MKIAVIDGQGGGIGRYIIDQCRKALPVDLEIVALGTNAIATAQDLECQDQGTRPGRA